MYQIMTNKYQLNLQKWPQTMQRAWSPVLSFSVHPQVPFFKPHPGGYRHHHSIIVCQTHSQCLRSKLLRPPSALRSGCRDERVWNFRCSSGICRSLGAVLICCDNQSSSCLSCTDQKVLRLAKVSVALWVLAITCWISDRFGCSFWQRLNFCYLHGIW